MAKPFLIVEFLRIKKHPITIKMLISKTITKVKIIPISTEFEFTLKGMGVRRITMFKERMDGGVTCIT